LKVVRGGTPTVREQRRLEEIRKTSDVKVR